MKSRMLGSVVLLAMIAFVYFATDSPETQKAATAPVPTITGTMPADSPGSVEMPRSGGVRRVVENVAIKNYDDVIYRGPVDLTATIDRIRAGERHPHRNDGSVFGNRERLLPQKPRGYYREYVHPTAGLSGPGPQRLVVGRDGDWWYTPDHYSSFIELGTEAR